MPTGRRVAQGDTSTQILDISERLVQNRGFNGFSYGDVAAELQITTAALHYHFPGKGELGEALVARYATRFAEALLALDAEADARAKLDGYASLYLDVLQQRRMCLCGMLAAEYETLPEAMRTALLRFFDDNERWLEAVLERGREDGTLQFSGAPSDAARMIVGALEGAMLVARPYGDVARFKDAAARLIAGLTTASADHAPPSARRRRGQAGSKAATGRSPTTPRSRR
jgi:TetR/AcrR family transcriptional regulator, transcriptional repressor for nem operon